jgi:ribosomal protein S18 acetylase RimI-like enzyme
MSEYGRERIFEIIQKNVMPPGHFQNVLAKRSGWLGLFCYDFEGPRWNQFIPVPGGDQEEVPEKLMELASDIAENPSIYGESRFVDEVVESLGLEGAGTAYEMTYLVPEDLPEKSSLPDLEFKRTRSEEVRDDFLDIFRKAFGEKKEDGSYEVGDDMLEGVRKIIREEELGFDRMSFVGYVDGEPVATGTLSVKDGDGFMFNVASHPDHRGEGLGSAVSVKLKQEAERIGLEEVFIGTQPGTDVENFYRKIGCREVFKTKSVEVEIEELK